LANEPLKRSPHSNSYREGDGSKAKDWKWKKVGLTVMQLQTRDSRVRVWPDPKGIKSSRKGQGLCFTFARNCCLHCALPASKEPVRLERLP